MFIFLLSILFTNSSYSRISSSDKQNLLIGSYATNNGFENGLSKWTNAGGTFVLDKVNKDSGNASGAFTASIAGQYIENASIAIPTSLGVQDCTVQMSYKGGDANLKVQIYNSGSSLITETALSASVAWAKTPELKVLCSDIAKVRITSTAAAALINVDNLEVRTALGSGSGGVGSPSIYKVLNAESGTPSDWTNTGSGVLTLSKTSPLAGTASYQFVTGALNDEIKIAIPVPVRSRLQENAITFRATADVAGMEAYVYDVTNAAEIQGSRVVIPVQSDPSNPILIQYFVKSNTASIEFRITAASFTSAQTLKFDDVVADDSPFQYKNLIDPTDREFIVNIGLGVGTTNTAIRTFSTVQKDTGGIVLYTPSASLGDSFTILKDGLYEISYHDRNNVSSSVCGISLNSTQLSTDIFSINASNRLAISVNQANSSMATATKTVNLKVGDVIRAHINPAVPPNSTATAVQFSIVKIASESPNIITPLRSNLSGWQDIGPMVVTATTTAPTKGTVTTDITRARRVGDSLEVRLAFRQSTGGVGGSGDYLFEVPTTFNGKPISIDLSKVNSFTAVEGPSTNYSVGFGNVVGGFNYSNATSQYKGDVMVYDSTHVRFGMLGGGQGGTLGFGMIGDSFGGLGSTNIEYSAVYTIPIKEWSSDLNILGAFPTSLLKNTEGEGYNNALGSIENPSAEFGTRNWNSSGGSFTTTSGDPLEGNQSFTFTPAAQNDYVESKLVDMNRDIFKSRACEVRIEYIGGDTNLSLELVDGANAVVKSLTLPVHTMAATKSLYFLCPTPADILADPNNGKLKLRIKNTGVSASPLIKFDKVYMGTLRGLVETTLPDVFSFAMNADATMLTPSSSVSGCVLNSTGNYTCNFVGLTVSPVCTAQNFFSSGSSNSVSIQGITSTGISILSKQSAALASTAVYFVCHKQGADAKQAVQVYKSIPKVSENVNTLSFRIITGNPPSLQSLSVPNWISCAYAAPGIANCVYANPGVQSKVCVAKVWGVGASNNYNVSISGQSPTGFAITTGVGNTASNGIGAEVICQNTGADFKMPTVQPILVNQVTTGISKGIVVESCKATWTGSVYTLSSDCSSFVSSIALVGNISEVTFIPGYWKTAPNCVLSTYHSPGVTHDVGIDFNIYPTVSTFRVYQFTGGSIIHVDFNFHCIGAR